MRRPIKWSRANFFFQTTHTHDIDNRGVLTVLPLAWMVPLQGSSNTGLQLAQAGRSIEIGGIKFTAQRRLMGGANDPSATLTFLDWRDTNIRNVDTKVLLVSDRVVIEPTSGAESPQALSTNWFTNTFPIATTPEVQDEDVQFPTRVHWQDYKNLDMSLDQAIEQTQEGEEATHVIYTKSSQQTIGASSGANLRLRLRLQDDEVLAFHFASHCQQVITAENLEPEIDFRVTGTLWYRLRF